MLYDSSQDCCQSTKKGIPEVKTIGRNAIYHEFPLMGRLPEDKEDMLSYLDNLIEAEKGANVKHWHGAAADSWFSHLAIRIEERRQVMDGVNRWQKRII